MLLAAALLTPLLGVLGAPSAGAAASPVADNTGVSAGSKVLWESDVERVAELDAIAASGARWFSMDIDWASIEYQRGKYRWATTDRVVLEAKARGLKILGIIAYSPTWARGADCPTGDTHCLPVNPQDYANFAKVVARRYGNWPNNPAFQSAIFAWQVWNEPNHYPFVQRVNVPLYTRMLQLTYSAIKSIDFWTYVIAGATAPAPDDPAGLDMSPTTFLTSIYQAGGKGSFDAFSNHPYSFPCSPLTDASWNAFQQTLNLHMIMAYNGDGSKRIWGTETGAPTGAPVGQCSPFTGAVSVTESVQAQFAAQEIVRWNKDWGSFTGPLFWFQIRDNGTDLNTTDQNFGLLRRNFTQKQSYPTFKYLMSAP
ncbi:MAG: hypothetical protein ACXVKN_08055 [Acidimicrobiia bacterium]